jgi:hypothetical protein
MAGDKGIDRSKAHELGLSVYNIGDVVRVESQKTNKGINISSDGKTHEFTLRSMGRPGEDKSIKDRDLELNPAITPIRVDELQKLPKYASGKAVQFVEKEYNSYHSTYKWK